MGLSLPSICLDEVAASKDAPPRRKSKEPAGRIRQTVELRRQRYNLTRALLSLHGKDSILATALGSDFKGRISLVIYLVAIPLAFVNSWFAGGLYVLVAIMWLVPDRRIETILSNEGGSGRSACCGSGPLYSDLPFDNSIRW